MKVNDEPLFVGVDRIMADTGVSKTKAYEIINQLNQQLLEVHPRAIVVQGKVNRIFYEEACLVSNR